jgi:hypothetical protein
MNEIKNKLQLLILSNKSFLYHFDYLINTLNWINNLKHVEEPIIIKSLDNWMEIKQRDAKSEIDLSTNKKKFNIYHVLWSIWTL